MGTTTGAAVDAAVAVAVAVGTAVGTGVAVLVGRLVAIGVGTGVLATALVQLYLQERDGLPERIVLDLDGTDDPAHGHQEGVAYHGYYKQHMLHPLLVFDGDTGQLISTASPSISPAVTRVSRSGTCSPPVQAARE